MFSMLWNQAVSDFQYSYLVMWGLLVVLLLLTVFWEVYDRVAASRFVRRNETPDPEPSQPLDATTVRLPETTRPLNRWPGYGPPPEDQTDRFV